jgi:hypothetical protein
MKRLFILLKYKQQLNFQVGVILLLMNINT